MKLTQENAHLYEGKTLDAHKRLFHYYPLEVKKINDEWMVKDRIGVCMPIPEEKDDFNRIDFDYIVEGEHDERN